MFFEFMGTTGVFTSIFILLSLSTYSSSDPSVFSSGVWVKSTWSLNSLLQQPVRNVFGLLGANISDCLLNYFGLYSFVISFIVALLSLKLVKLPEIKKYSSVKLIGYTQLSIWLLGLMSSISPQWTYGGGRFSGGGFIGQSIHNLFNTFSGKNGSQFIFIAGIISVLPLCFGFRPITVMGRILSRFQWPFAKKIGDALYDKPIERTHEIFRGNPIPPIRIENQITDNIMESDLMSCLNMSENNSWKKENEDVDLIKNQSEILVEKMESFGVQGVIIQSQSGPVVNTYEFEPAPGVKVSKVLSLQEDLALCLKAQSIVMAPQPGKSTIGIQVPNPHRCLVPLVHILQEGKSELSKMVLPLALGRRVDGSLLIADLAHMPHILVAGSTGSGKSVAINSMLVSLITQRDPQHVRFLMIDPKMLELCPYEGIGHLLSPVVSEPKNATQALLWAVGEMERRYGVMKEAQVRNIHSYNDQSKDKLPYIVVVVDELCDLMMTSPKETEEAIQRLAQKSRAAGIHLLLATQRPSVDVITGVIKANLPCRIAFQVSSKHDSRTIIETMGAEKLLGKGDMLYLPPGTSKVIRAHGAYVDDESILKLIAKAKIMFPTQYSVGFTEESQN